MRMLFHLTSFFSLYLAPPFLLPSSRAYGRALSGVFLSMAGYPDEQSAVLAHQLFRNYAPSPNRDGMVC